MRFFNRFDYESLFQMMTRAKFRVLKSKTNLFLEKNECAILVNGEVYMFSHTQNVTIPHLLAIYSN